MSIPGKGYYRRHLRSSDQIAEIILTSIFFVKMNKPIYDASNIDLLLKNKTVQSLFSITYENIVPKLYFYLFF